MQLDVTEKLLYGAAFLCTIVYILCLLFRVPKKSIIREYAETGTVAVWLALGIRFTLVEPYSIPSESMRNTLLVNDHLAVNKFIYGYHLPFQKGRVLALHHPKRGDIVIFIPPINPLQTYVKRCVALPGDVLEVRDGDIFINGQPSDYPQAIHEGQRVGKGQWNDFRIYAPASAEWFNSITVTAHTYWAEEGGASQVRMPAGAVWNKDWYGPLTIPAHTYWMMG